MRPSAVALILAAAALVAAPARAQNYRRPLGGTCTAASCYVTAYYDLDASGGLRDWNCGTNTYNGHRGTDFGVGSWAGMDAGRDVVAAADGDVVIAHDGEFDRCSSGSCPGGDGYGNWVRLRHADGKTTTYGHLKNGSVRVGVGDRVACGQVLGQVGSSGYSTGPHLHFEVRTSGGTADDPFTGPCGGPLAWWVDQGAYDDLPGTACEGGSAGVDDAAFVSETVPDGSRFHPGEAFVKRWTMRNAGTTTWTEGASYGLAHDGDERFGAAEFTPVSPGVAVAPGASADFDLPMIAPAAPGLYRGYWRMDRRGTARFGTRVWIEILVEEWPDSDGDTVRDDADCDDGNPEIRPGAAEICNGSDDDCDGATDEDCGGDAGADADADGGDDVPDDAEAEGSDPVDSGDGDGGEEDGGYRWYPEEGCGCAVPAAGSSTLPAVLAAWAAVGWGWRRRRR